MRASLPRRIAAFLSPFSACLFALAIPGPCTTFDDVASPEPDAAALADAADAPATDSAPTAACPTGIRFAFEADAGCQEEADQNCCIFETECAKDEACVRWVTCVNACPTPRAPACVSRCGGTRDASFGNALTGLASCRNAFDGGGSCVWP